MAVGLFLLSLASGVGRTQHAGSNPAPPQNPTDPMSTLPDASNRRPDDPSRPSEEKMARLRNDDRQRRLVADTDKLLLLATQLHDDVSKTDKNILSMDVVRRADEIEKLAHSVKEHMKS